MHNKLKDLNQLHCSEETKKSTLQYVLNHQRHTTPRYTKSILASAVVVLICMFSFFIPHLNQEPNTKEAVAFVSFDINPSLEFQLDTTYQVIQVKAYNQDAQKIIDRIDLKNKSLEDAVRLLLTNPSYDVYLKDGILEVGVYSKNNDATKLENLVQTYLQSNLSKDNYHCAQVGEQTHEEANRHHTSFGKYRVIEMIQSYDSNYSLEDLTAMSMAQLYTILETYDASAVPSNCQNRSDESKDQPQEKSNQNRHRHGK
ncbi:anti-sigma-I factor RsgI family protein [Amedibacillus sp. YH-ame6]